MPTFDYNAAIKAGKTMEEIDRFLASKGLSGATQSQSSEKGILSGVKTFGKGFVALSKSQKGAQKSIDELNKQAERLINAALKRPIGTPERARLFREAQIALGTSGGQSREMLTDILPTEKQFAGGALEIGLLAATPFLPSGAGILGKMATTGKYAKLAATTGKAIAGGAYGYGLDKAQQAIENKEITPEPGVGTAIGAAFPFVTALAGSLLKRGLGITTRSTKEVIQRSLDNPDAIGDAVKKFAGNDATKMSLVERGKLGLNEAMRERSMAYGEVINNMVAKQSIPKSTVTNAFIEQAKKFGGRVVDGELRFSNTALTKADQSALQEVWGQIGSWTDVTPKGLDTLRQMMGGYLDQFKYSGNSRANVVLGAAKRTLENIMKERIPGYADALADYGAKTQAIQALSSELSATAKKPTTQINAIMRIFKKDPEVLKLITKVMGKKEAEAFLDDISGAILSEWIPTGAIRNVISGAGLGALGVSVGPSAVAAAPLFSPRIVGAGTRTAGRLIKKGLGTLVQRGLTLLGSKSKE